MSYRPLPHRVTELEEEILELWERHGTFRRSLEATARGPSFVFYEGPPTANGRPGIHHVISRTIKDVVCRYRTMTGRHVLRIAGWDTHGLPVEVEAEKALGISGKPEIEKVGVERFVQVCRESVFTYKEDWEDLSRRIGYWLDYSRAYITYTPEYIESVWWALEQFHQRGLLHRGHKVVPYCPRCGTALSSHEVALGYEEVEELAVTVKFSVRDRPGEHLLAWTTTPWTLPGNLALAAGPEIVYVKARVGQELYYVAEALAERVLGENFEVVERRTGRELSGIRYEPPFPYLARALGEPVDAWYVATADFVAADEGTGLVHTAVMYGEDDYELGIRLGLPRHHLVDEEGRFTAEVEPWAGKFVKDADPEILRALRSSGRLFREEPHRHTYPFCWRCEAPLLYYARDSWYLRTTAVKERLLEHNAGVQWHPPEIGRGRMGEWLENNVDWALSRDRYWGTPLPVWVCERDAAHVEVIGSYRALTERAGRLPPDFDPHKPAIDALTWACAECGGRMRRTPEVVDAWFDSGAMPIAQWHFPFENRALFERQFPADFIAEGVDQTRGWFYSLLAISTVLFDCAPYRHVVVNDLVLDASGQKMSKSRGNVVDPWAAVGEFGADAIRFYLLAVSQPWVPKRYDPEAIREVNGRFFDTLRNTYGFFAQYANLEGWVPGSAAPAAERRPLLDRWILSELDRLIEDCREDLESYELTHAARRIAEVVVDDLSNWYVRRSRPRFWGTRGADREDMAAAFATLEECLLGTSRLLAPIAPFFSDWAHRQLTGGWSAHLAAYPAPRAVRDRELEEGMAATRRLANLGHAVRDTLKIRVRQPLRRMVAAVPDGLRARLSEELLAILADELNVKQVRVGEDVGAFVRLRAVPNFRHLGPTYGKVAPAVAEAVRGLDSEALRRWRGGGGPLSVTVNGSEFELDAEAFEVREEAVEGMAVRADGGYAVAIDASLDDELRREGTARELVNRIQRLRRDSGLRVEDRIRLGIFGPPEVADAAQAHKAYIASETLAVEIEVGREAPEGRYRCCREVQVDGTHARIALEEVAGGRSRHGPGNPRPGRGSSRSGTTRRPSHR